MQRMNLNQLYPHLSADQRKLLAEKAGIGTEYLRQLAGHHATNPSIEVVARLAKSHDLLRLDELVAEFTGSDPAEFKPASRRK